MRPEREKRRRRNAGAKSTQVNESRMDPAKSALAAQERLIERFWPRPGTRTKSAGSSSTNAPSKRGRGVTPVSAVRE
jgi:hypothetical protein